MATEREITDQLSANIIAMEADTLHKRLAIGQMDSAINAIESNNLLFACDRLALAIANILKSEEE